MCKGSVDPRSPRVKNVKIQEKSGDPRGALSDPSYCSWHLNQNYRKYKKKQDKSVKNICQRCMLDSENDSDKSRADILTAS